MFWKARFIFTPNIAEPAERIGPLVDILQKNNIVALRPPVLYSFTILQSLHYHFPTLVSFLRRSLIFWNASCLSVAQFRREIIATLLSSAFSEGGAGYPHSLHLASRLGARTNVAIRERVRKPNETILCVIDDRSVAICRRAALQKNMPSKSAPSDCADAFDSFLSRREKAGERLKYNTAWKSAQSDGNEKYLGRLILAREETRLLNFVRSTATSARCTQTELINVHAYTHIIQ